MGSKNISLAEITPVPSSGDTGQAEKDDDLFLPGFAGKNKY
jgi:hypothetical protein